MDSQSDSQSKDLPETLDPNRSLVNVLTMRADRSISYQVIKLAYEIGMLPPEEVTGGHPAITELRQLVKSWDNRTIALLKDLSVIDQKT